MSKLSTVKKLIQNNPRGILVAIFNNLVDLKVFSFLPDVPFLKLAFRVSMGERLHLDAPKTFNEKLQWLKLFDRNPQYTDMVDKLTAKAYVKKILGSEFVIPTLKVWETLEQIDLSSLPKSFVIKTNNGSGGNDVIVCRDKNKLNKNKVQDLMKKSVKVNTYTTLREWPYKNIVPKVFAEEFIADTGEELHDYKFFCFRGKAACFKVDFNRWEDHRANYYSPDLKLLPFGEVVCPPDFLQAPPIPKNIAEMITVAEKLSSGFPFMRVDLYNVHGKIYFGEMTFYPASGLGPFTDKKYDYWLGGLLELPYDKD